MKKAIIGCLAILLAASLVVIAACDLGEIGGTDPEGTNPYTFDSNGNVVGVTATVNADGDFYIPAFKMPSRALNMTIADRGIQVFEVVFLQGPTGSETVARANWTLGEAVSVKNVPRSTITGTPAPVNYYAVDPTGTLASPANDNGAVGAAVLFAGRKNGTLLAVGRITAINGTNITGTSAPIDASTRSVTFSLAALQGSANTFTVAHTTIANVGNPLVKLGDDITPLSYGYKGWILKRGVTGFTASYTLTSSSTGFTFANMVPAIRLKGSQNVVKQREVSILGSDGEYEIPGVNVASITPAFTTSLTTADDPFPGTGPQLAFTIDAGTDPGIISLYFEVPVYALNNKPSSSGDLASQWYIRNGYNYNSLDIGPNGTGGSIFIYVHDDPTQTSIDFSSGLQVLSPGILTP